MLAAIAACGSHNGASPDATGTIDGPGSGVADAPGSDNGSGSGSNLGGSNGGSGTGTLTVVATIAAASGSADSSDPTSFTTAFDVTIRKSGAAITTGTVTVTSSSGAVPLIYDATAMAWHGTQSGYFDDYELDITSGSDAVSGVVIDGPDIHVITAPAEGSAVDATKPTLVTWMRAAAANTASIRARAMGSAMMIPDTGSDTLPVGSFAGTANAGSDRIDLTRTNLVTPSGAAAGSRASVSVVNYVDVTVTGL